MSTEATSGAVVHNDPKEEVGVSRHEDRGPDRMIYLNHVLLPEVDSALYTVCTMRQRYPEMYGGYLQSQLIFERLNSLRKPADVQSETSDNFFPSNDGSMCYASMLSKAQTVIANRNTKRSSFQRVAADVSEQIQKITLLSANSD